MLLHENTYQWQVKHVALFGLLLLLYNAVNAQSNDAFSRHEISFYGMGGIATFQYKSTLPVNSSLGLGGGFGIGYSTPLNAQLNLYTGLELLSLQNKITGSNIIENKGFQMMYNGSISDIVRINTINNLTARMSALNLQIPVFIQIFHSLRDPYEIYAAAGLKFGFIMSKRFKTNIQGESKMQILNTDVTFDTAALDYLTSKTMQASFGYAGGAEAGVRWKIDDDMALCVGIYADVGLSNTVQKGYSPLLSVSSTGVNSSSNDFFSTMYISGGVSTFSAGLKVRFELDAKRLKKELTKQLKKVPAITIPTLPIFVPQGKSTVQITIRDAYSLSVLPTTISNIRTNVEENMPVAEIEKNVYRLNIKDGGVYMAALTVNVPPHITKQPTFSKIPDTSSVARNITSNIVPSGKGLLKITLKDSATNYPLLTAVKVLDRKSLLYVDEIVHYDNDKNYVFDFPENSDYHIIFHVGTPASNKMLSYQDNLLRRLFNKMKSMKIFRKSKTTKSKKAVKTAGYENETQSNDQAAQDTAAETKSKSVKNKKRKNAKVSQEEPTQSQSQTKREIFKSSDAQGTTAVERENKIMRTLQRIRATHKQFTAKWKRRKTEDKLQVDIVDK